MTDYWVTEDFVKGILTNYGYTPEQVKNFNPKSIESIQELITAYGDKGAYLATAIELGMKAFLKAQQQAKEIFEQTGVAPEYIDL